QHAGRDHREAQQRDRRGPRRPQAAGAVYRAGRRADTDVAGGFRQGDRRGNRQVGQARPRTQHQGGVTKAHCNSEPAYHDTADAIARWPETATAVAARSSNGRVELLAPHGVDDLVQMTVRPTPAFASRQEEYIRRLRSKDWQARWPRLTISMRATHVRPEADCRRGGMELR